MNAKSKACRELCPRKTRVERQRCRNDNGQCCGAERLQRKIEGEHKPTTATDAGRGDNAGKITQ